MSVRRVLMTGDTVGGVWTFTLELAAELWKRGVEVALLTMGADPSDAQKAQAAALPGLCLLSSAHKLEWMDEPWEDVEKANRWIAGLAEEYCPDVLHFNSYGQGARRWSAPVVLTAHSCVLSWWQAVHGQRAPRAWDRYRNLVQDALRTADVVTVPSASFAAALAPHYKDLPECRVIPNGRDRDDFYRTAKEPFVFSAGRLWDEAKNLGALAAVASNLSWPVYIAGETGGKNTSGCHPLGRLSGRQIRDWYARASIYVLPARYEPFGLSVLEAALSGCALVLGDIPSLREIWGDDALFVAPDDRSSLERTIQKLVRDEALRRRMADRAYDRALLFPSSRTADLYLRTYLDVAMKRSSACVS